MVTTTIGEVVAIIFLAMSLCFNHYVTTERKNAVDRIFPQNVKSLTKKTCAFDSRVNNVLPWFRTNAKISYQEISGNNHEKGVGLTFKSEFELDACEWRR